VGTKLFNSSTKYGVVWLRDNGLEIYFLDHLE